MKKRRTNLVLMAAVIIALFYFFTRFYNLGILPMFLDEANYIYWGKLIASTGQHWFIPLSGQKNISFIWSMAPWIKILPENAYLIAGRIPSVLAGAATLLGIYKLSRLLFSSTRLGIISALLYVVTPYTLLHDRMALYDSFLTATCIWSFYFALKTSGTLAIRDSLFWGTFLGLAFLTKATAILFWFLTPLCFFLLLPKDRAFRNKARIGLLLVIALATGQLLNHSIIVSSGYKYYMEKSLDYTPTIGELLQNPTKLLGNNLSLTVYWFASYLTTPIFAASILGSVLLFFRSAAKALLLVLPVVISVLVFSLLGRIYFPRYILFTAPFLAIAAAYALEALFGRLNAVKLSIVTMAVSILALKFDYHLLTSPTSLSSYSRFGWQYIDGYSSLAGLSNQIFRSTLTPSLPAIDDWQYISGNPSGYGLETIYQYLDDRIKNEKITLVIFSEYYGQPLYSTRLRYWDNKNLQILRRWPPSGFDEEIYSQRKETPVYFLMGDDYRSSRTEIFSSLPLENLLQGRKPGGRDTIYLTRLKIF